MKRVFVTGGNTGIGLALCKQLAVDHGCYVYLGSRSLERGQAALKDIASTFPQVAGQVELVQVDTSDEASIAAAAAATAEKLKGEKLYALVNNAGTGLAHEGVTQETVLRVNLFGPKMMCDKFMDLIDPSQGRIVNVGSGAGPMYVAKVGAEEKKLLTSWDTTWEELEAHCNLKLPSCDGFGSYGLSKSGLSVYTMILSKQYPKLVVSCITPGFIDTAICKGFGASKKPEEGTVSIRHCLFQELGGSGWFWGSDAVRSPLDKLRNPGEPAYTGA